MSVYCKFSGFRDLVNSQGFEIDGRLSNRDREGACLAAMGRGLASAWADALAQWGPGFFEGGQPDCASLPSACPRPRAIAAADALPSKQPAGRYMTAFVKGAGETGDEDELDEETADKAIKLAGDVEEELDHVDAQALGSKAVLAEQMSQSESSELRQKLSQISEDLSQAFSARAQWNRELHRFYDHLRQLEEAGHLPETPGRPFLARDLLEHVERDTARIRVLLEQNVRPAREALEEIGEINVERHHPHLTIEDRALQPLPENDSERLEEVRTASGCICDPTSRCASNGRDFSWCEVASKENQGEQRCALLANLQDDHFQETDPTGVSHELVHTLKDTSVPELGPDGLPLPPPAEPRHFWDYCTPPEVQAAETRAHPDKLKTAHFNCTCAFRNDLWQHYANDPKYRKDGHFMVEHIPFRDRFAVEAMQTYFSQHHTEPNQFLASASLCGPTPSSGGFSVCPVSKECARDVVAGADGMSPTAWFAGLGSRNWDFCVAPEMPAAEMPAAGTGQVSDNVEASTGHVVEASMAPLAALPWPLLAGPAIAGGTGARRRARQPPAACLRDFLPAVAWRC